MALDQSAWPAAAKEHLGPERGYIGDLFGATVYLVNLKVTAKVAEWAWVKYLTPLVLFLPL